MIKRFNYIKIVLLACVLFQGCTKKSPKVLIIGDSISGSYLPFTQKILESKAILINPEVFNDKGELTSCEGTSMGVKYIDAWIGDTKWDIIHFNFGLHDIKHIDPKTGKNSKNLSHPHQANPEQYGKKLKLIVKRLKATNAKLIFATTTPYPDKLGKQMRAPGMPAVYNKVAVGIMKENNITINDLYAFVLPQMDVLQRPRNVHFTEFGSKKLAEQVAKTINDEL